MAKMILPFAIALIAISLSATHAQQVYRCTLPDGSTVYQGTQCESDHAEMKQIYVAPGPSPEESAAAQARLRASQDRRQLEAEYEAYQAERRRLLRARDSINLGLDQSVSDLMANRNRYRTLNEEVRALDHGWQDRMDPAGAGQRAESRRQNEAEARLSALEREQRRARREEILRSNQPVILRNCRTMGDRIHCAPE